MRPVAVKISLTFDTREYEALQRVIRAAEQKLQDMGAGSSEALELDNNLHLLKIALK